MRIVSVGLLGLLLAACQQPGNGAGKSGNSLAETPSDSGPQAGKVKEYFLAEVEDLDREMGDNLAKACLGSGARMGIDKCFRGTVVKAFDDSGEAGRKCRTRSVFREFVDCVMTGNMILQFTRQLGSTAKLDPDFWSSQKAMAKTLSKAVAVGAIDNCSLQAGMEAKVCAERWVESKVNVPDSLLGQCPADAADHERWNCLGQAMALRFMQQHIGRIGGVGV